MPMVSSSLTSHGNNGTRYPRHEIMNRPSASQKGSYSTVIAPITSPDNAAQAGFRVLDLGTGGGFPGIPLAVMFPNVRFTLCDSVGKKTIVAREIANMLGLDNVEIVNAQVLFHFRGNLCQ